MGQLDPQAHHEVLLADQVLVGRALADQVQVGLEEIKNGIKSGANEKGNRIHFNVIFSCVQCTARTVWLL